MKKIKAIGFAFYALAASAALPDPSAWYTPSKEDYRRPEPFYAAARLTDSRGTVHEVDFKLDIDEEGNVTQSSLKDALGDLKLSVASAVDLIDNVISATVESALDIHRLDAQFTALGKNLTKVFQIDGMRFVVSGKSYNLRIAAGALKQAAQTGSTVEYRDEDGLFLVPDGKSMRTNPDSKHLELSGWSTGTPGAGYTIGDILKGKWEEGGHGLNSEQSYAVPIRTSEGTLQYTRIGSLQLSSGVPVDNKTITTNSACGALVDGYASLYGWFDASVGSFPVSSSTGTLTWRELDDLVDNKSLGVVSSGGRRDTAQLELKGASMVNMNNRYFGTPRDGSATLGWWDLPNVTTNAVEGDEKTITTASNELGIKRLGWASKPPIDVPSLAVTTADGGIGWVPFAATNDVTAVDNDSIATNENGAIGLKGWRTFTRGFLGKTEGGDLVCKEMIPTNGIARTEDTTTYKIGLAGFDRGGNCSISLSDALTNPDESSKRGQHQILTRFDNGTGAPVLHYMPIGGVIQASGTGNPDNASVVTNEVEGKLSIRGFNIATEGMVPIKIEDKVEWRTPPDYVTTMTYKIEDNALNCILNTKNIVTGVEVSGEPIRVCDVYTINVVTDISYVDGVLKMQKQAIRAIGVAPANDAGYTTIFETTPLSEEILK